ncbi:uncharacterized protein M6B38_366110 [Iris pallida]|uniref:Uncharacterized protein n=1 Tax=Iris pallida TaxID=29817 RepID=A0AAX6GHV8_IRIPA|nr:uncharacterized protein M6B38_366110 [Iris pallida]
MGNCINPSSSGPHNSSGYISQAVKLGTQVLPTYRVFSLEELREATKDFDKSSFLGGISGDV